MVRGSGVGADVDETGGIGTLTGSASTTGARFGAGVKSTAGVGASVGTEPEPPPPELVLQTPPISQVNVSRTEKMGFPDERVRPAPVPSRLTLPAVEILPLRLLPPSPSSVRFNNLED